MIKGNITKSTDGFYTVSIFSGGERIFKQTGFTSLSGAQECLKTNREVKKIKFTTIEE